MQRGHVTRVLVAVAALFQIGVVGARAATVSAGSLVSSFGTGGQVMWDVAGSQDQGLAVGVQPDGEVVVAAMTTTPGNYSHKQLVVARFTTTGARDMSFGGGSVT